MTSPDTASSQGPSRDDRRTSPGRTDWTSWPAYDAAELGFSDYWYPVQWSSQVTKRPLPITLRGERLVLLRDGGRVYALNDRCLHRGVPLSLGRQEFPGTLSCPYHGWTYRLTDGELCAVITDGPDSPICGKVAVRSYPVEERLGLVWVFSGTGDPHPLDTQLPGELTAGTPFAIGGRIEDRRGNWRLAAENGFDEGHAKYLHRTSLWRLFKTMPTWNRTHIEQVGRWIYRVQDEVHWDATFPGVGTWSNRRWWKQRPPEQSFTLGNTGAAKKQDPVIAGQGWPGFASLSLPGVLRIAYPQFIHYEFYVPMDRARHRYVGFMVQFKTGLQRTWFFTRYLGAIRWLFHGNFSDQDAWMVEETDCPPERLYRPDSSLLAWRRLCEQGNPFSASAEPAGDGAPADGPTVDGPTADGPTADGAER
ncbi:MAG: Rieske (2Fe-2S) iron-sulfur protein [Acidimicrobiaceae bacterium]|nr:Rieske (2Fe-2S) iron-sulfur protein [Acidimicrobiaceae bacterium]